ncbi:hypothetical protein [Hyphomicrobium sp.]|nr:hypothetical protein [Hyphomicrobium sp.]MBY0561518.1 hypothetical protein [Hyphomicrobium sp.]
MMSLLAETAMSATSCPQATGLIAQLNTLTWPAAVVIAAGLIGFGIMLK